MKKKLVIDQEYIPHYSSDFFHLLNHKYDLTVLYNNDFSFTKKNNFKVIRLKSFNLFGSLVKIKRFIKIIMLKPDFVVLSANQRDIFLPFTMILLKIFGFKVFVWGMFHRVGGPTLYSQLFYLTISKLSNASLCYSSYGLLNLISLGCNEDNIKIVGNGISHKKNFPNKPYIRTFGSKIKFLGVIRLSKIKNPMFYVKFASFLVDNNIDFHITLIGGGECQGMLYDQLVLNKLSSYFTFLDPIYDENILKTYFLDSHFSFIPQCPGLSIHHSFAYSLPVITSSQYFNNSSEFMILNNLNSLIFDLDELNILLSKIINCRDNQSFYELLQINAYSTFTNNSLFKKVQSFEKHIQ